MYEIIYIPNFRKIVNKSIDVINILYKKSSIRYAQYFKVDLLANG